MMNLPFPTAEFFEVFAAYNQAVFPVQFILIGLSLVGLYLLIRRKKEAGKYVNGFLALLWLWMAIVYHLVFFSSINPAAILFGVLFIVQGGIFLLYGFYRNRISYCIENNVYGVAGMSMIVYSILLYPLLGWWNGHIYPASPTFGLPCPTTIFTFGILLFSISRLPWFILIIPVIWSIVGFSAALNFGMMEDGGLLIAGILTCVLLWTKNRIKEKHHLSYEN